MNINVRLRSAPAIKLRFQPGATGPSGTVTVNPTTITGAPGTDASVANTGTPTAAVLQFTIPRGNTGTAATVAAGTTTTGAPGTDAAVANSGSSSAAVFDFTIPRGNTGTAATIAVGTVTTGAPLSSATVTNVGTSGAAVFDFSIPRGADGVSDGDKGDVTVSSLGTVWTIDAAVLAPYLKRADTGLGLNNRLINGAMRVSQLGTSFSVSGDTLDQWVIQYGAGGAGTVVQNPITADDLAFSLLWSQTTGGTGPYLSQAVEDARTLAGKRVCISFSAAVISGTTTLTPRLVQYFGTGGSPSAQVVTTGTPITLTGGRVFQFMTLPSIVGKTFGSNGDSFLRLDLVAANGATFVVSLTDVQLEEAAATDSIPTPFERIPIGLDRVLCMRYFQAIPTPIEVPYGAASPAQMISSRPFAVPMRASPAVTNPVAPALSNCTSFTVTATRDHWSFSVTITGVAGQYGITGSGVLHFNARLV